MITVQWTANLNNGTTLTNALVFKTPKPTQQEAKANPNKLGYEHTMSEGSVRKEWNIEQVETVLPLLQPMATHAANPATFIPTSHIAPTQMMPNTSQSYIQQFNRNQVTQSLPYSQAEAQGPGAAMSTETVMKLNQSGDSTHYHAGQTIVNATVNEFIHQAESPLILNQHQSTRTQIQEGNLYARTHLDHHRNSHREVAVHGTLKQNLANSQVTIDHANQTVQNTKVTAQTYLASTQTKTVKRGMTSIQAGSVNIGGGYHGSVQKAQLQVDKMLPQVEISLHTGEVTLPPRTAIRPDGVYIVIVSTSLSGQFSVRGKNSVNPVTFDEKGFKVDATKAVSNFFSNLTPSGITSIFSVPPTFTISNNHGNYAVSLSAQPVDSNTIVYTGTLSDAIASETDGLELTGTVLINLSITISKQNTSNSWIHSLEHELEFAANKAAVELALVGTGILIAVRYLVLGIIAGAVAWSAP